MKHTFYITAIILFASLSSCSQKSNKSVNEEAVHGDSSEFSLTDKQFKSLGIHTGTLPQHVFTGEVSVTGRLNCMPQSEAAVTSYVGANVTAILVTEGQNVRKGQILAWLSHPDILDMQTRYLSALNRLAYVSKDYQRQQKLYSEKIGSGKDFQQIQSEYRSLLSEVEGLGAQLRLIGIAPAKIRGGKTVSRIPLTSPISGTIEKIEVETGQYADPQKPLFHVVNTDHVFADFLLFEKDLAKVQVGQEITFSAESAPEKNFVARIYSIGKVFENSPKAVHVRAHIEGKVSGLISGMFLQGKIKTEKESAPALAEEGIVDEGGEDFIFIARREKGKWYFKPVRIQKGRTDKGFIEVKMKNAISSDALFALDNAYYLMSEMKKSETGEED